MSRSAAYLLGLAKLLFFRVLLVGRFFFINNRITLVNPGLKLRRVVLFLLFFRLLALIQDLGLLVGLPLVIITDLGVSTLSVARSLLNCIS